MIDARDNLNLWFVQVKDKDPKYQNWECEIDNWIIRILKNKNHPFYSVYAKRYVEENWALRWYMEISSTKATTLWEAKQIAEKMYDIVLWYKVPWPWKE